ncbi:MAG: hypothetical protein MMC33_006779 [Icmadophila ericetorum]|nr:hypothetical protein [Icmadophila ericetorum]
MVQQAYYQKAGHVIAAAVVLPVLDFIAVGLRFYTRRKQRVPILADDWITIPALILVLGLGAGLITGVAKHGLGYPTPPLVAKRSLFSRSPLTETNPEITISSQIEWQYLMTSILALGCIKLSFLFFYRRIFCKTNKRDFTNIFTMVMICIIILWTIGFFFAHLFACGTNFSAWWGAPIELITRCVKTEKLLEALAISDFLTDAIIVVIPLPLVWRLHLTTPRKLAVSAVFLLGCVAFAASITRMVFVARIIEIGFNPDADEDLLITELLYWGMIECGLGLFAACLPTLRFLFKGFSIESIAASVRSALSLQSMRSENSRSHTRIPDASTDKSRNAAQDTESTASQTYIIRNGSQEGKNYQESYAMTGSNDVETGNSGWAK